MEKRLLAIILVILTVLSITFCLSGCSSKDSNFPVTVGHTTLKKKPDNVVVLSDNIADIVYYTGYSTQISAISDSCNQEVLTKYIESVGSETAPDVDGIVRSGAKYVLIDTPLSETITEKLTSNGIEIIEFIKPATVEQLLTLYGSVCKFFGGYPDGKDTGTNAYNNLISTMEQAQKSVEGSTVVKLICYLYLDENKELRSFNSSSCEGMVLNYVCATNVATNFANNKVDESILRLSNPDYLFYDNEEVLKYLNANNALSTMNALKDNHAYLLPKENLQRMGTSMIETQSFIISKLYPNSVSQATTGKSYASDYGIKLSEDISYQNGDNHEDIKAIQQRLIDLGYLVLDNGDDPTTYFGGKSEDAVKRFQTANGLEATGVADYETLNLLFLSTTLSASGQQVKPAEKPEEKPKTTTPTESNSSNNTNGYNIDLSSSKSYELGDTHADIKVIQQRLEELLYISFSDGDTYTDYYGEGTQQAISSFQESNELEVTGVASYDTLKLLFSSDAEKPN